MARSCMRTASALVDNSDPEIYTIQVIFFGPNLLRDGINESKQPQL